MDDLKPKFVIGGSGFCILGLLINTFISYSVSAEALNFDNWSQFFLYLLQTNSTYRFCSVIIIISFVLFLMGASMIEESE